MKEISGKWLGFIFSSILFFGGALVAFADSPLVLINPLSGGGINNFGDLVTKVGAFLLALAVPLCGIMVIVGGFQMMTAAGDPKKFSNGRQTLVYAAIGFVVVLFASSVVPLLKSILGG